MNSYTLYLVMKVMGFDLHGTTSDTRYQPDGLDLLESVLVELVQFVPVSTEEGSGLLDPLALQRPSS